MMIYSIMQPQRNERKNSFPVSNGIFALKLLPGELAVYLYLVKTGQAYLSRDGIRKIKSVLTNDIFKQEMLHAYEQKSASRDELVRQARDTMKALAREMRQSTGDHPAMESLVMTLVDQLETVKGKKKYGYLPKWVKKTVDEIVDQMERLPVIDECY